MADVSEREIHEAAEEIRRGGLVAFPTETVYGLGADALNAAAVENIFRLKRRPHTDPLIVHVAEPADVSKFATGTPLATRLAESFWPGPLTMVLVKRAVVPDAVTSGLSTVALRCPAHDVALRLIRAADRPIAAPSANRFGKVSPTTAAHVRASFGADCPLLLDAGPCRVGVESTVVALEDNRIVILRPGGVTAEELADCGQVTAGDSPSARILASPGMLPEHYAPQTPLVMVAEHALVAETRRRLEAGPLGVIRFGPSDTRLPAEVSAVEDLSASGDLAEAAANLYAAMRRLDERRLRCIVAAWLPASGLGVAINDRLRRAAARDANDDSSTTDPG